SGPPACGTRPERTGPASRSSTPDCAGGDRERGAGPPAATRHRRPLPGIRRAWHHRQTRGVLRQMVVLWCELIYRGVHIFATIVLYGLYGHVAGPVPTDPGCQNRGVIGRLEKTVFDCPDPRTLAAFYAAMLGIQINEDSADWVVIGSGPGARQLAF